MAKCKITVLRRMLNQDLADEYCKEEAGLCEVFTEGQEFIYDHYGEGNKPENFCEWAWHDIYKTVMTLSFKGNFGTWMKDEKMIIQCCTDGIRPVVFKVERIDD
jgi:uncharacterized repeat protein (TIGR04076 family)